MRRQGHFKEEWKGIGKKKYHPPHRRKQMREEYLQRRLGIGLAKKRRCSCCDGTGFIIEELPYKEQRAILDARLEDRRRRRKEEEE